MENGPDQPTVRLVREALDDARDLVRLELALARDEVSSELRQARSSVLAFCGSAAALVTAFALCMVAGALAFSIPWAAALTIAAILLIVGVGLGLAAYKTLPARPLAKTKERIERDLNQLRERRA